MIPWASCLPQGVVSPVSRKSEGEREHAWQVVETGESVAIKKVFQARGSLPEMCLLEADFLHVCLFVCVFICLSVCLSVCLLLCFFVCFFIVCLLVGWFVRSLACLRACCEDKRYKNRELQIMKAGLTHRQTDGLAKPWFARHAFGGVRNPKWVTTKTRVDEY